tara:strand:+ start:343 stop:621 length:279 start_codon:yes stop_codon:yes gene_type:complete
MTAFYKRKFSMGDYKRNDEEEKARLWCHENNICITPRQSKWGEKSWIIEIETGFYPNRKKIGESPQAYGPGEIWKKICEYQKYYYGKYKNKV